MVPLEVVLVTTVIKGYMDKRNILKMELDKTKKVRKYLQEFFKQNEESGIDLYKLGMESRFRFQRSVWEDIYDDSIMGESSYHRSKHRI